ncbi:hypothetical protein cypCar_00033080 [Cyprinus carpio]|nr:hypothetical protein cypCar_00033080 [Cyprinus carpio]
MNTYRESTDNGYMPMRSYQKRSNQTGRCISKEYKQNTTTFTTNICYCTLFILYHLSQNGAMIKMISLWILRIYSASHIKWLKAWTSSHPKIYEVMRWCWSADPLKRPTFKKLVERTELLLSETTKHDYLNLSTSDSCEAFVPPGLHRAQRLSSVGSSTASTQPLLQATNDVFLEHQSI